MKEMKRKPIGPETDVHRIGQKFVANVQSELGLNSNKIVPADLALECCVRKELRIAMLSVRVAGVVSWPDGDPHPEEYNFDDEYVFDVYQELLNDKVRIPGINIYVYSCRHCGRQYTEDQAALLPQH